MRLRDTWNMFCTYEDGRGTHAMTCRAGTEGQAQNSCWLLVWARRSSPSATPVLLSTSPFLPTASCKFPPWHTDTLESKQLAVMVP